MTDFRDARIASLEEMVATLNRQLHEANLRAQRAVGELHSLRTSRVTAHRQQADEIGAGRRAGGAR